MPYCQVYSFIEQISYPQALRWQTELHQKRLAGTVPDTLLLLEHPPTITLGRGSHPEDLLTPKENLSRRGIEVIHSDRGGEITYHAPGQLVGYPVLDLREHGQDLHRYLRDIEEALIQALATLDVIGKRKQGLTGVWVKDKKIAAIGIKVSRWVTMHGFALNMTLDLSPPRHDFVPCGIRDFGVTSLAELQPEQAWHRPDVERAVLNAFASVFQMMLIPGTGGILSA